VALPELTAEPVYAAPPPALGDVTSSDIRLTSLVLEPETKPAAASASVAADPAAAPPPAKAADKPAAKPLGDTARLEGEGARSAVGAAS